MKKVRTRFVYLTVSCDHPLVSEELLTQASIQTCFSPALLGSCWSWNQKVCCCKCLIFETEFAQTSLTTKFLKAHCIVWTRISSTALISNQVCVLKQQFIVYLHPECGGPSATFLWQHRELLGWSQLQQPDDLCHGVERLHKVYCTLSLDGREKLNLIHHWRERLSLKPNLTVASHDGSCEWEIQSIESTYHERRLYRMWYVWIRDLNSHTFHLQLIA